MENIERKIIKLSPESNFIVNKLDVTDKIKEKLLKSLLLKVRKAMISKNNNEALR